MIVIMTVRLDAVRRLVLHGRIQRNGPVTDRSLIGMFGNVIEQDVEVN